MKNLRIGRLLIRHVSAAILCCTGPIYGQWTSGLLFEGFGPGGWASLNYTLDRDIDPVKIQMRAGAGLLRLTDFENRFNPDLSFPLGLEAGYGEQHRVLAGGGIILTGVVRFFENSKRRQWQTHYYLMAGYKLLLKNGWYLKVAYTPLFERGYFRNWGTAGIGYYLR